MKFIKIILASLVISFVTIPSVSAREVCFTQYGGGETCVDVDEDANIDVDKEVSKKDGDYQDHLKSSVHQFSAEDKIYFKITVKNKGDVTLKEVELKDTLPSYVEFYQEIDGDADLNGKVIKFDLGTMESGEEETVKFIAKVVDDSDLPKDDKVCLTNIATAKGERKDNGDDEKDSDYSNFCIDLPEVKGEKPTQLPKAGAGAGILALIGGVIASVGTFINRKLNIRHK